ncbi:MAG: beta-N-acetylhexosaminidase [Betaproteobacteria bacterium]|nr:beta-N-acetylhexosaminidase [Betaproteobacteria bacterium]
MTLGPVMADVAGTTLTDEDVARLQDPLIGSIILFARNFESPAQLRALTAQIKAVRTPHLLIAVDHEGGRVQRFHEGFTKIPPMRELGTLWDRSPENGLLAAREIGYVIGAELGAHGVDFSFAPVLDLDWGASGVIGHRAFHREPGAIAELAGALIGGLHEAGTVACGKHFPGHGHVRADSHHEVPRDDRSRDAIYAEDMIPFARLAKQLDSIMPAHVIYENVDSRPAGFSPVWLQQILRTELGFGGILFSDDLTMEGASVAGDILDRAVAAFAAGCDIAPVCNNPQLCDQLLAGLRSRGFTTPAGLGPRLERLRYRGRAATVLQDARYRSALATLADFGLV